MALPTILVNSSTGSDSAASGAGPSTALTGTNASTSGDGLTVTLDGSPDLTNVATDGSHVIYLADSTAGNRNFGKITAKDDGADTVTVSDAFGATLSGLSWAIGGKRASIGDTNSRKLFDNNALEGDAMPGWVIELESGHTETLAAMLDFRRDGDLTSGPIILRGASGAGTRPILTWSSNSQGLRLLSDFIQLRDFDLQNSNATKTASVAVDIGTSLSCFVLERIRANDATNNWWKAFRSASISPGTLTRCRFGNTANIGVDIASSTIRFLRIDHCIVHDCGSHGISYSSTAPEPLEIFRNLILRNGGDGIRSTKSGTTTSSVAGLEIRQNIIHGNSSDGIEVTGANITALGGTVIEENIISGHTAGNGINFSSAAEVNLRGAGVIIRNNGFYNNSTHRDTASDAIDEGSVDMTADPYVDAANDDFNINNTANAGADLRAATLEIPA